MNKELENEIWESFLKAAVIENSLDEIKTYPSQDKLNQIVIPQRYDLKMQRLIKHYNYKGKLKSTLKYSRKIASIILLFLGISFILFLGNDDVRAACKNIIIKIYDQYIHLSHTTDLVSSNTTIEFGYIPDGFSFVESSSDEINNFIVLQNSDGDFIELKYDSRTHASYIDNEHYIVSPVQIGTSKGFFLESQDNQFMNILIWDTSTNYFQLTSSLEKEELIKIAENIK